MKEKIAMEKEINNNNFKGLISYLRKHYGDEGVQLVTRGLINSEKYLIADKYDPLKVTPVQEHHLLDNAYWVSNEFSLQLLANVKKVVSGPNPLFTAGENSVINHMSKSSLFMARIFGPKILAHHVSRLNARFNRTKEVRLVELTDSSAIFELHYKPGYHVTKDVCNWNLGIYSGMARLAGVRGGKIEEIKCVVDGSECCVFTVTWKKNSLIKRLLSWLMRSVTQELVEDYEFTTRQRDKLIDNLKQSEERYRVLTDNSLTGIYIIQKGVFVYVNDRFTQMLNYSSSEMIGKKCWEFLHPEYQDIIKERLMTNSGENQVRFYYELCACRKDGELIWFQVLSTNIEYNSQYAIMGNVIDITERKQMEKEIARLDRLNLISEMAAGIGHEIRNPMTTVRGLLQVLGGKKVCIQYKEYYDLMIEELDRANSIITEYLSLARNKVVDLKAQNLNNIVQALSPLIQADAMVSDKYYQVELKDIPDLLLDEKEIRQLILNLVRNGLEAMSPRGILTIRTFADSEKVVLAVQDQGKGIEPRLLERMGTPFFSTKDNGTGLGLAVCYSIAARHNGTIKVETGPKGTTFYVWFRL